MAKNKFEHTFSGFEQLAKLNQETDQPREQTQKKEVDNKPKEDEIDRELQKQQEEQVFREKVNRCYDSLLRDDGDIQIKEEMVTSYNDYRIVEHRKTLQENMTRYGSSANDAFIEKLEERLQVLNIWDQALLRTKLFTDIVESYDPEDDLHMLRGENDIEKLEPKESTPEQPSEHAQQYISDFISKYSLDEEAYSEYYYSWQAQGLDRVRLLMKKYPELQDLVYEQVDQITNERTRGIVQNQLKVPYGEAVSAGKKDMFRFQIENFVDSFTHHHLNDGGYIPESHRFYKERERLRQILQDEPDLGRKVRHALKKHVGEPRERFIDWVFDGVSTIEDIPQEGDEYTEDGIKYKFDGKGWCVVFEDLSGKEHLSGYDEQGRVERFVRVQVPAVDWRDCVGMDNTRQSAIDRLVKGEVLYKFDTLLDDKTYNNYKVFIASCESDMCELIFVPRGNFSRAPEVGSYKGAYEDLPNEKKEQYSVTPQAVATSDHAWELTQYFLVGGPAAEDCLETGNYGPTEKWLHTTRSREVDTPQEYVGNATRLLNQKISEVRNDGYGVTVTLNQDECGPLLNAMQIIDIGQVQGTQYRYNFQFEGVMLIFFEKKRELTLFKKEAWDAVNNVLETVTSTGSESGELSEEAIQCFKWRGAKRKSGDYSFYERGEFAIKDGKVKMTYKYTGRDTGFGDWGFVD